MHAVRAKGRRWDCVSTPLVASQAPLLGLAKNYSMLGFNSFRNIAQYLYGSSGKGLPLRNEYDVMIHAASEHRSSKGD